MNYEKSPVLLRHIEQHGATQRLRPIMQITLIAICVGLGCGCAATRTSPKTAKLADIQKQLAASTFSEPKEAQYAVGIRYPAAFQTTEAKLLMVEQLNRMMTRVDKKGNPRPDNNPQTMKTWQYFPEETIYKSLTASLQLRDALIAGSNVRAYLVPCYVTETNGQINLTPLNPVSPQHATIDVNVLNVLVNCQAAPWFKWQGASMSRFYSPLVAVRLTDQLEGKLVAGTRRWLSPDKNIAVTLPEILARRYTGNTYGLYMNYPTVSPKDNRYPAVSPKRPADSNGYYEFPSFLEREKTDKDFSAYWVTVAQVVNELLANSGGGHENMAAWYARELGLERMPESKRQLAQKFIQAEWMFNLEKDRATVARLNEANWFTALENLAKSEDTVLGKAKSRHFWNQFSQGMMAFAGGAAMGVGSAAAMQSGTYYNSAPTTMMMMNAIQALGEAGAAEQAKLISSYKDIVLNTENSVTAVSIGLEEEGAGVTIKKIEDIRKLARKLLGGSGS